MLLNFDEVLVHTFTFFQFSFEEIESHTWRVFFFHLTLLPSCQKAAVRNPIVLLKEDTFFPPSGKLSLQK